MTGCGGRSEGASSRMLEAKSARLRGFLVPPREVPRQEPSFGGRRWSGPRTTTDKGVRRWAGPRGGVAQEAWTAMGGYSLGWGGAIWRKWGSRIDVQQLGRHDGGHFLEVKCRNDIGEWL